MEVGGAAATSTKWFVRLLLLGGRTNADPARLDVGQHRKPDACVKPPCGVVAIVILPAGLHVRRRGSVAPASQCAKRGPKPSQSQRADSVTWWAHCGS